MIKKSKKKDLCFLIPTATLEIRFCVRGLWYYPQVEIFYRCFKADV